MVSICPDFSPPHDAVMMKGNLMSQALASNPLAHWSHLLAGAVCMFFILLVWCPVANIFTLTIDKPSRYSMTFGARVLLGTGILFLTWGMIFYGLTWIDYLGENVIRLFRANIVPLFSTKYITPITPF